ncbi:Acetyltransferase (GNAT) family protein [Cryobacterium flavum]|uniref:Acetyltransferase (GNAT) family protein n=1 Tax=Cryobacterium flavum TaxID=1424659 RepID=A0A4V3I8P1_9MICO|nr:MULTISPECIES: GNAT family N-acetyltransferase [Cryobacterium]TFB75691.1 GNAT family N-acetyltransferase [Cryobacterium flavum]SDN81250.1 Acetyltransferase (GNAT) family protein [Cryobacterium flavum]
MPQFHAVSVADAAALTLLTEYFSSPELSFRQPQGTYHPTYPLAEQFVPPQGIFLAVLDEPTSDGPAGNDASGAYVGCGGIRRLGSAEGENEPVRFEVKHLWIQPTTRGRGWGRLLLAELERRAAELGGAEVVLDTNVSLATAGALYQSTGYESIPSYNDNPNATHWYCKRL